MKMPLPFVLCALFALHEQAGAASAATIQDFVRSKLGLSRYQEADVVLNGSGTTGQYLVYARDSTWCGATGGCTLFILTSSGGNWHVLSRMTLVHLPVRVLPHLSKGWHDLEVSYSGKLPDGRPALVTSHIRFDGARYPLNPSVPPAEPVERPEGQIVLAPDSPIQTSAPQH
ncbi:hypothetical protein [Gluconobacter roseus]|uniref:Lipoprotein n=1 Tax=Gluconobacter roseus NBRC 3990 TaxID=1307950 RepID=A0A4Y3M517_9PROT|nr:hypothetical protein [Gluconobacter roseus]GBR42687.1 hypothetical protein AA3990_0170 [Gluconobacter roseus NBRC 3990]GEB03705.1 hypothetical protein GRO01_12810 [Gluconobacter roseus NBRC 3990]GLP94160.1 hypothetical protein GCM10007871_21380 [Gluconobacter roseus NBRC 3990]